MKKSWRSKTLLIIIALCLVDQATGAIDEATLREGIDRIT